MSWVALPVEPACMDKAVGEAGRPLMLCGARLYIITIVCIIVQDQIAWNMKERMGKVLNT